MKIYAMFGVRDGAGQNPELVDAWDEYTRDENPEGYDEAREKWAEGSSLAAFAVVTFEVDEQAVQRALFPPPVPVSAEVVEDWTDER